jgi:RNA polymerase sigma-70 factor (ECF subfamily)
MPADDERQLILDAQKGSREAFRLLVERHMKQAYNVAFGVIADHDEAEDIAQEAFVRVHRSIRSFRGDSGFGTWLYRIVMNVSINRLRQKKVRERREVHLDFGVQERSGANRSAGGFPGDDHAGAGMPGSSEPDFHVHLERALHKLPTLQRAVVILRHMNGMSTKQVGSILNCSEGTVKTHLHRGLRKMRTMLDYLKVEGLG